MQTPQRSGFARGSDRRRRLGPMSVCARRTLLWTGSFSGERKSDVCASATSPRASPSLQGTPDHHRGSIPREDSTISERNATTRRRRARVSRLCSRCGRRVRPCRAFEFELGTTASASGQSDAAQWQVTGSTHREIGPRTRAPRQRRHVRFNGEWSRFIPQSG